MINHSSALRVVIFLLLLVTTTSCSNNDDVDLSMLAVEDLTYQLLPSGARIVSGTVYNPTESAMGSVQIQLSLFDKDNVRVDALSILVRDLDAGSRVPFREAVNSDYDVTAARVKGMIKL